MMRSGSEGTTRREGRSPAAMALLANAVFVLTRSVAAREAWMRRMRPGSRSSSRLPCR